MGYWPYADVIAHRCGGALAPENTLAGLDVAAQHGARMVEFDVMLAGCGTPVLIHDETLERTTNGSGQVCDTPYEALAELDAGSWFAPEFSGERVPLLTDALARCAQRGLMANVEIKPAAGFERVTAERVARLVLDQWRGAVPPLLSSFSIEALTTAREVAPSLPRGVLFESVPADWQDTAHALGAVSVHCAADGLTEYQVRDITQSGLPVLCYTVNDTHQAARLRAMGVAGVFSDRLDLFCPAR